MKKLITTIVISILLVTFSIEPFYLNITKIGCISSNKGIVAKYNEAYLEKKDDLLILHVKGSGYEMGYQHGILLKDHIQHSVQYLIQKMMELGYSYEYMINCAKIMVQHIPEEYIDEIKGLADGACLNYTDTLIAQIDADLQCIEMACSSFAVFGKATKDGHLYHGRNLDAPLSPQQSGLVIIYEPENGNPFVSVGGFGKVGVHTGINKNGISIALMSSLSNDTSINGTPILILLRKVLQYASNLADAVHIINQTRKTTGWNIVLGDGANLNACAAEVSHGYCKVFWAGDSSENIPPHHSIENAIRRTNHYISFELAVTQRSFYDPRKAWNWSWDRYEKLGELILENYGKIDAEMAIEFLKTYPIAGWYPTIQSVMFDSTDLELWVANANSTTCAYLREFIYLSRQDLFPSNKDHQTIFILALITLFTSLILSVIILHRAQRKNNQFLYLLISSQRKSLNIFSYKVSIST
ncbi:MAG: C45 family peptidase [Candidatus Bathyarchaeia archaeon]